MKPENFTHGASQQPQLLNLNQIPNTYRQAEQEAKRICSERQLRIDDFDRVEIYNNLPDSTLEQDRFETIKLKNRQTDKTFDTVNKITSDTGRQAYIESKARGEIFHAATLLRASMVFKRGVEFSVATDFDDLFNGADIIGAIGDPKNPTQALNFLIDTTTSGTGTLPKVDSALDWNDRLLEMHKMYKEGKVKKDLNAKIISILTDILNTNNAQEELHSNMGRSHLRRERSLRIKYTPKIRGVTQSPNELVPYFAVCGSPRDEVRGVMQNGFAAGNASETELASLAAQIELQCDFFKEVAGSKYLESLGLDQPEIAIRYKNVKGLLNGNSFSKNDLSNSESHKNMVEALSNVRAAFPELFVQEEKEKKVPKVDSALEEEYGSYKNWKLLSGKSVETLLQELHGVNSLTSTTHNNFVDILNCETVGDMEQLIRDIASEQFVKQSRNNKDAKSADEVTAEQSDSKDDGEELYPQGIELNKSAEFTLKDRSPDEVLLNVQRRRLAQIYLKAEGDKWKSIVESQLKKDYKSNPRLFVSSLKGKELDTEFKSAVDKLQKRVTTFDTNIEHAMKHNDDLFVEREKDRKWKAELLVSKYLWDENGHLKSKGIPGRLFTKLLNDAYDTFLYLGKVDSYSSTNIYNAVAVFKGRWEATRMSMFKSAQSGNLTAKDFVVNLTKFLDEYNILMPKVVTDDAVAKKRRISDAGQFRMKVQVANWTKLVAEDPDKYSEIAKLLPKEKFMNLFALPLGRDIAYERKSYTEVAVLALLNAFREYACGKSTPNMKAEDKTLCDKKVRACDGAFFNEMRIAFVMNGEVTPKTIAEKLDATNIEDTYKRFAMAVSNSNTLLVNLLDKWGKERARSANDDTKEGDHLYENVSQAVKNALNTITKPTSLDTEATEAYLNLDPLRAVVKQVYGASGVEKLNAVLAEEGVNKGRIADTLTKMQIELNERKALEAERRKIVPEGVKRAVEGVVFEDGEMDADSIDAITEALKASGVKEGGVDEWQVFATSPLASNKEAIMSHLQTKIFV